MCILLYDMRKHEVDSFSEMFVLSLKIIIYNSIRRLYGCKNCVSVKMVVTKFHRVLKKYPDPNWMILHLENCSIQSIVAGYFPTTCQDDALTGKYKEISMVIYNDHSRRHLTSSRPTQKEGCMWQMLVGPSVRRAHDSDLSYCFIKIEILTIRPVSHTV